MLEGLNSDLNLNRGAPQRVRPVVGEWGPHNVATTRAKKVGRWLVVLGLAAVITTLVVYGHQYYVLLK